MRISGKTKLCIIIGDPIEHTLSPAMHNAAYESLGIDDQFVYVAARVKVEKVQDVVTAVRTMNIRGLTCTVPHKIEVMKYLDRIDPAARNIGAVNTVVNENGLLHGYNTDWLGAVQPLEQLLGAHDQPKKNSPLYKRKVAIIGAGGAARAIAWGVIQRGAQLALMNRSAEKAHALADELKADADVYPLSTADQKLPEFEIIINATSAGMFPHDGVSPVSPDCFRRGQIVFDAVYAPHETTFLRDAASRGATIIHGSEMLLHQATKQFELYTNHKAPERIMRETLRSLLQIS